MIKEQIKHTASHYPKNHLIIAGVCTLVLGISLAVLPSQDASAKRTVMELEAPISAPIEESNKTEATPHPIEQSDSQHPESTETQNKTDIAKNAETNDWIGAPETFPTTKWQTLTVKKGDTLSHIFKRAGLSARDVHRFVTSSKDAKALTNLRPGEQILFDIQDKKLLQLKREINNIESTLFVWQDNDNTFSAEHHKKQLRPFTTYTQGTIDSSLFLSAQKAGLSQKTIMELAQVFGWDIDFALDIRKGDKFSLIYEELYLDGEKVRDGDILAAQFVNQGETFTAIRYTKEDGSSEFFTPDGDSMRKAFLRTPVDFARISSHFNLRRKHPVLHTIRAHKGTDYAASTGTPIKATGDGKVHFVGRKGGYGRVVIIKHGERYQTLYAHMHRFARGMKRGKTVSQGQIIGYVGSSGLATGPHLHYEFYVNGRVRNPVTVKLPHARPVPAKEKEQFLAHAKKVQTQFYAYASSFEQTIAAAE
ncbi:MAG: peptidoglycan DD-metalloendopeptidase family protein [Pseudomonadales bacterium]|nr:peptidoglycan DD-metalloendopeptidase family protein [Pseudomonadales bacterium]